MSDQEQAISPRIRKAMTSIVTAVEQALPEGYAFLLVTFKFDSEGVTDYVSVSNTSREDMLTVFKDLVARWEEHPHTSEAN